jgi:hypothetical protein
VTDCFNLHTTCLTLFKYFKEEEEIYIYILKMELKIIIIITVSSIEKMKKLSKRINKLNKAYVERNNIAEPKRHIYIYIYNI